MQLRVNRAWPAILTVFVMTASAAAPAAACGIADVCTAVTNSFYGHVQLDGVVATWSTEDEDEDLYYVLKRYDCGDPSACSVEVAVIPRTGTCGTTGSYQVVDDPPGPASAWTYTLEVWRETNVRACAIDTVPQ